MAVELRAMTAADVAAVERVWQAAFNPGPTDAPPRTEEEIRAARASHEHLLRSDPAGSSVAVRDGSVVGLAQAHRRGRIFTLARLAVDPASQGDGIGRRLLDAALTYGADAECAYIFSSDDPRALHRYVRAGFHMSPTVRVTPPAEGEAHLAPGIRVSGWSGADLDHVDRIDEELRGSSRRVDLEHLRDAGQLLLCTGDGYAVLGPARVSALGARSQESAAQLLRAALTGAPDDRPRGVGWVADSQQWAIRVAAECGASLEVHGAVMTRGVTRHPFPYLPHGLFA